MEHALRRSAGPGEVREISPQRGELLRQLADLFVKAFPSTAHPGFRKTVQAVTASLDGELRAISAAPPGGEAFRIVRAVTVGAAASHGAPSSWASVDDAANQALDTQVLLLASLAGRPFAWRDEQGGRLVANLVPAWGAELSGPHAADSLPQGTVRTVLLVCVRNPRAVAVEIASNGPGSPEHTPPPRPRRVLLRSGDCLFAGNTSVRVEQPDEADQSLAAGLWLKRVGVVISAPRPRRALADSSGLHEADDFFGAAS